MDHIAVKFVNSPQSSCCPRCGETSLYKKGLHLFEGEMDAPLCRGCGKRLAPNLLSLTDLAHVADRAARQSRHLLTPSMETLLALARAAENYACAAPEIRKAG